MHFKFAALLIFFLLFVLMVPPYLGPDNLRGCSGPTTANCAPADAIIAVSGGDTVARTEEALSLYQKGWAPLLIFSGAAADKTGPSNALAMKRLALASGVPEDKIVIEEFSQNTAENAVNTSLFIKERQLQRVILVTSAYHQRRAHLEFSVRLGQDVEIVDHPVAHDIQWGKHWWLSPTGWRLAFSELTKITVFYVNRGVAP